jgi:hypothetical protein
MNCRTGLNRVQKLLLLIQATSSKSSPTKMISYLMQMVSLQETRVCIGS